MNRRMWHRSTTGGILLNAVLALVFVYEAAGLAQQTGFDRRWLFAALGRDEAIAAAISPSDVVNEGQQLVVQSQVKNFSLSRTAATSDLFVQRITESTYPIRREDRSRNVLAVNGEGGYEGCRSLYRGRATTLYACDEK